MSNSEMELSRDKLSRIPVQEMAISGAEEVGTGAISPAAVLHSLRRNWKFALPIGLLLAAILAPVGWILIKPQYTATAYLRLQSKSSRLVFETADASAKSDFDLFQNTQAQLMVTPLLLQTALRSDQVLELRKSSEEEFTVDSLREDLKVAFPNKSEIMSVSLETTSPTACITVVNAVVDAYMEEAVEKERNARVARYTQLQQTYQKNEEDLRQRKEQVKRLADDLGSGNSDQLSLQHAALLSRYSSTAERLAEINWKLTQAEIDLQLAKEMFGIKDDQQADSDAAEVEGSAGEMPEMAVLPPPKDPPKTRDVLELESRISELEAEYQSLSRTYADQHPIRERIATQIATSTKLLEDRKRLAEKLHQRELAQFEVDQQNRSVFQKGKGSLAVTSPTATEPISLNPAALKLQVERLRREKKEISDTMASLDQQARQIGQSSVEVDFMRSEIKRLETVLEDVGSEMSRTAIELQPVSRIEVLNKAEQATPPEAKKRIAAAGGLGLLGLFAPLALFVGRDLLRRPVDGPEAVKSTLSVASFGTLPHVRNYPALAGPGQQSDQKKLTKRDEREQEEFSEAIKSVAGMVMQHVRTSSDQVFMVTSPSAGEGKSTTACQLASCLTSGGKRVLLLETDMRRPSLHRHLGTEPALGLGEVLLRSCSVKAAVQQVPGTPNLYLISAGQEWTDLHQSCADNTIDALFSSLRENFDIVIVDSCPVLPVVDSRLIASLCDGVFLTLRRDTSRLPNAEKACEILRDYGGRVLGTIVVGVRTGFYTSKYSYQRRAEQKAKEEKAELELAGIPR